jgi:hypothetical protein
MQVSQRVSCGLLQIVPQHHFYQTKVIKSLTLKLTTVGGSAHTFFKGLYIKKSLSAKNQQKIPIPYKTSAKSKSRVMYPSKNVNLCLFYASKQAKALKKVT